MKILRRLIPAVIFLTAINTQARSLPVHCDRDVSRTEGILTSLHDGRLTFGERLTAAAMALEGGGYDDYYMTDSVGALRINTDSFTPLMYVNNVIALAKASETPGPVDINTFARELENISCRRGENTGFPSIMFHSSDWIGDNIARGNLAELTEDYAGVVARTKSLDEMTRKRSDYAALSDSVTFETVRMTEMGFRTHRVPTLKKETIKKKELIDDLRDGDIILLVPNRDGIDLFDIGFVAFENGTPKLIHLSPQTKTIVKETDDLARYFSLMTKYFQGYRILRVKE